MKKLLAVLLLLVSSAVSSAPAVKESTVKLGKQPNGDVVVKIPAEMVKACQENGGCAIVNQMDFAEAVNRTIQENKKEICDYKEATK